MIPSAHSEIVRFKAAFAALPEGERPDLDPDTLDHVLCAAGKIADDILAPLDRNADRQGARLVDGKIVTPDGYKQAWRRVAAEGWLGLDLPEVYGGQGLPVTLKAMTGTLFDRAGLAFNMACGSAASACALLAEHAPEAIAQDWVPALITGKRTATICVSEADAGSDLGRMTTQAERDGAGWRIHGEKKWIGYGQHDMVARIGHCLLARTSDAPGGRGLSLFLVPGTHEDGSANGVSLLGIEDKLGLRGSPTCRLRFDGAKALLLGTQERGLPQMFTMIALMRLQVACQGLSAAARATDIAERYAQERRQGGDASAPPVPILFHPDVQRQLAVMRGETEVLRAVIVQLAALLDRRASDPEAAALAQFLLPLVKARGAEIGFEVANQGIQVLGGVGYTKDWPLEQTLRDIRVASVYEGTTGMQGLDFLERRLIRDPAGYEAFCEKASGPVVAAFGNLVEALRKAPPEARHRAADAAMRAGWCAVTEWLGPRLPDDAHAALDDVEDLCALHIARARRVL